MTAALTRPRSVTTLLIANELCIENELVVIAVEAAPWHSQAKSQRKSSKRLFMQDEQVRHLLYENAQLQKEKAELIEKVQELIAELSAIRAVERRTTLTITTPKAELEGLIESIRERGRRKLKAMEEKHGIEVKALTQRVEEQQSLLSQVQQSEATLKERVSGQEKEIERLKKEVETQKEKVGSLKGKLAESDAAAQKALVELKQQVESDRKETTAQFEKEKNSLKLDYEAVVTKKEELEKQVSVLNQRISECESQEKVAKAAWQEENAKCQERIRVLQRENNELRQAAQQHEDAYSEITEHVESMKQEREKLVREMAEKTKEAETNSKQICSMKESIEQQTQKAQAEYNNLAAEHKSLRAEAEKYKAENTKLQTEMETCKRELHANEQAISALKAENEQMKTKLESANAQTKQQLETANRAIEEKDKQLFQLTSDAEKTTEQYRGYETRLQSLSVEVSKMNQDISARDAQIAEQKSTIEQLQAESAKAHEFEERMKNVTMNTSDLVTSFKSFRELLHPGVTFSDQDESDLDFASRLAKEISTLREMFLSAYKDVERLIQEKSQFSRQAEELQKLLDESKKKTQTSTHELSSLKLRIATITEELGTAKYENELFAVERQNFSEALAKMRASLQMLKSSLQESEREKKELKEKLVALEIQNTSNLASC